jgi:hypothetical protein
MNKVLNLVLFLYWLLVFLLLLSPFGESNSTDFEDMKINPYKVSIEDLDSDSPKFLWTPLYTSTIKTPHTSIGYMEIEIRTPIKINPIYLNTEDIGDWSFNESYKDSLNLGIEILLRY